MKTLSVTIEGITPLLMHSFPLVPIPGIDKMTPEDQAEHATYRDPDGKLYVPGIAVQRAFIGGATYVKGKGRASLQKPVCAGVFITPERIILAQQSYVIDSRPVVIAATKGRIVRHRPRFDKWTLAFTLEDDPELISAAQMREIVDSTGKRVGLLDFRPERKGPFGTFAVTQWQ